MTIEDHTDIYTPPIFSVRYLINSTSSYGQGTVNFGLIAIFQDSENLPYIDLCTHLFVITAGRPNYMYEYASVDKIIEFRSMAPINVCNHLYRSYSNYDGVNHIVNCKHCYENY